MSGNDCGFGCSTLGQSSQLLYGRALALKDNNPDAVAAVVVGGDPGVAGGVNFCGQPGTCCGGQDCDVFHATKLWEFVGLLNADTGTNGLAANLCAGPQTVPGSVSAAFTDNIDIACQEFEPPR